MIRPSAMLASEAIRTDRKSMLFKKRNKSSDTVLDEFIGNLLIRHRDYGNEFIQFKDMKFGSSSYIGVGELRFHDRDYPFGCVSGTSWDVSVFVKAFFYASTANLIRKNGVDNQLGATEIIRTFFDLFDYADLPLSKFPFDHISKAFYSRFNTEDDDLNIHHLIADREFMKATGEHLNSDELSEEHKETIDSKFIIADNGCVFKRKYMI